MGAAFSLGAVDLLTTSLYAASTLCYQTFLLTERPLWRPLGQGALLLAIAFHSIGEIGHGYSAGRFPLATPAEVVSFFAWMGAMGTLLLEWRLKKGSIGAVLSPWILLGALYSLLQPLHWDSPSPLWQEPLLGFHVSITVLGYVGFLLAFALAVLYLVQERSLKAKRSLHIYRLFPPLDLADEIIWHLVVTGFTLFTLGLITGFLWMMGGGHRYLHFPDWKIIFSLATWAIYSVYLYLRLLAGWRGRRTNLLIVVGFMGLLITFLLTPHNLTP